MKTTLKKFLSRVAMMLAVCITCLLVIVGIVFAVESVTVPSTTIDFTEIFQSLVALVGAFVAGLISIILNKIRQKYGIQLSAENEAWIQSQAEHAVQYTSEIAAKKMKINAVKISGNALLATAVQLLVKNVPKLTNEQAAIYVQAALARIAGIGATGDKSLVVK